MRDRPAKYWEIDHNELVTFSPTEFVNCFVCGEPIYNGEPVRRYVKGSPAHNPLIVCCSDSYTAIDRGQNCTCWVGCCPIHG